MLTPIVGILSILFVTLVSTTTTMIIGGFMLLLELLSSSLLSFLVCVSGEIGWGGDSKIQLSYREIMGLHMLLGSQYTPIMLIKEQSPKITMNKQKIHSIKVISNNNLGAYNVALMNNSDQPYQGSQGQPNYQNNYQPNYQNNYLGGNQNMNNYWLDDKRI